MSCSNLTAGITTGCNNSIGGIQQVQIANGINSYTLDADGQVVNISFPQTPFTFDVDNGAASFTETYEVNQTGSILGFRQSVTIQLNGLDAAIQQTVAEIAEANGMVVFVLDNNNTWWTLGLDRGAYLETGSTTTGTAYTDIKAATLTITSVEPTSSRRYLNLQNYSLRFNWRTYPNCQASGPADQTFSFNNGTVQNAKCEYDNCNTYLLADPLGCYPLANVSSGGQSYRVPYGTVAEVGTQLYNSNGTPATVTTTFWNIDAGFTYNTGTAIQLSPNITIGRTSGGVIVELFNQSDVTC